MLSKKMKSILTVALCAVMTIVAIPMLPAKAEDTETTTCTDCAECTDYKMTIDDVTPGVKSDWESFRTVEDTDTGLKVTYPNDGDSSVYSTRTTTPVALDGAHMKLTTSGNARFIVVINNGGDSYNDITHGLKIRIEKWSSSVTCLIDNSEVIAKTTLTNPITDTDTTELLIKTTIDDNGDLNIAINNNNLVIPSATWKASSYMDVDSSYFLVSNNDGTGYAFSYTWNYIHGGEDVCYNEVAQVESLIDAMTTYEEIIVARKAYLALSEAEKSVVENASEIKATAGQLTDSNIYKMTKSNANPAADKWPGIRDLVDTDDGLQVTYTQERGENRGAYSTRTVAPVVLNGARMKITTSGEARFIVVINNGGTGYNDITNGLKIRIEKWSSKVTCLIDNTVVVEQQTLANPITDADTTEILIKTTIKENGDLNIAINDNNIVIAKATWEASSYMNANSSYFLVSNNDGTGYAFTYTWNYICGGDAVSYDALSDAEKKIELCHPTTPIKAYVDDARAAYDDLSDELKAIVINYDKLESAEASVAKVSGTDFYNYGLTEANFLTDNSGTGWDSLISRTQVSNGWNINFHSANGRAFNVRENRAIALDGAHIGLSVEHDGTNDKFFLSLANTSTKDGSNFLFVKLDTRTKSRDNGGVFYLYCGSTLISTADFPDNYSSTYNDRVLFPVDESNEMDIRFDVDASGNVYVTVNGSYIKVTKEQLDTIGFVPTETVYIGVAPDTTNPNITLHYSVSGAVDSYDEVTGDTNGDDTMNVLDLARMKNNEEAEIKDILYYRTSSDLDKDGNSCDAEDLDLLRKGLVK